MELAIAAGFLLTTAFTGSLVAQDSGPRVNVGVGAGKPGDPLEIPFTLSGSENDTVGSITAHVGFPNSSLSYAEAERGLSVELAEGEVEARIAENPSDDFQSVVEFSAQAGNCIAPGILGYLKFNILVGAEKGEIALKLIDSEVTRCEGGAKQTAMGEDGRITIFSADEQIPSVACFVFSH